MAEPYQGSNIHAGQDSDRPGRLRTVPRAGSLALDSFRTGMLRKFAAVAGKCPTKEVARCSVPRSDATGQVPFSHAAGAAKNAGVCV